MNKNQFLNTVIKTLGTEVGTRLISFVTTIILVRNLSAHDYGIFALMMSFALTLCYLSAIGLPQGIIYFIGKFKDDSEKYVSTYQFLIFLILFTVLLVTFLFKDNFLNSVFKDLSSENFTLLLLIYALTMIDASLMSIVRGFKYFNLFNLRKFLTPVCNLIAIALIFFATGIRLNYILISFLLINIILTIGLAIKSKHLLSYKSGIDYYTAKSFIKYGLKSYLQNITGHLIYQVDLYIIAFFLSAAEVAYYGVAVGLATVLWYIPNTVGIVLFPTLSSEKNEQQIHLFSTSVCRHTLFFTSMVAIAFVIAGKYILTIFYGAQYIASLNAMLLILPGIVVMSAYKVLARNLSSRNRQQVSITAAAVALVLNVVLNFIWIPRYGIEGAAVASTVSYIIAGSILVLKIKIESTIPLSQILFVNGRDFKMYCEKIGSINSKYKSLRMRKR